MGMGIGSPTVPEPSSGDFGTQTVGKQASEVTKQLKEGLGTAALPAEPKIAAATTQPAARPDAVLIAKAVEVTLSKSPPRVELTAAEFMKMVKDGEPLPVNATVKGNVSISKLATPLPAGLHVEGDMKLLQCKQGVLPLGLEVTGSLHLSSSKELESLPTGLKVGKLSLVNCAKLSTLPEDVIANSVNIAGTKITSLPKGIEKLIGGYENIPHVILATLPPPENEISLLSLNELPEEALKIVFTDGSAWKEMLLTHTTTIISSSLQNLFNIIKSEVVQAAATPVLECLQKFEKPPGGLEIFQNFTRAVEMSGIGAQDHLEAWGTLATRYLDIACKADLSESDRKVVDSFRTEISNRSANNQLTYEWFALYCDRLSILMTRGIDRIIYPSDNTMFNRYRNDLMQQQDSAGNPGWHTHEGYVHACNSVGDVYVQTHASPLALTKMFPRIVEMPFPFELDAREIFFATPSPKESNLWAEGFVLKAVDADGMRMAPAYFKGHDQFHLIDTENEKSLSNVYFDLNKELGLHPPAKKQWDAVKAQGAALFDRALSWCKDMIAISEVSEDETKMDAFFAFYIFHSEGGVGLANTFILAGNAESLKKAFSKILEQLLKPDYYRSSLPDSLLALENNKEDFLKAFETYAENFTKRFCENTPIIEDINKWLKSFNAETTAIGQIPASIGRVDLSYYMPHDDMPKAILSNVWKGNLLVNGDGVILKHPQREEQSVKDFEQNFFVKEMGIPEDRVQKMVEQGYSIDSWRIFTEEDLQPYLGDKTHQVFERLRQMRLAI